MSRILLVAALAILYLYGLSNTGLVGPDEPRYASIGREMARSGDWITPRLWGDKWFEKPALLYWLSGLGFKAGLGLEVAPRLPSALAAVGFLVFFWRFLAKRLRDEQAARNASYILATSAAWVVSGFAGATDMLMSAAFGVAMLSVVFEGSLVVAGIFLGVAMLAKGLVPVVLFLPVALWLLLQKRYRDLAQLSLLALLVSAPWYIACARVNGREFFDEFFLKHHLSRFTSGGLQHVQPWWFYLPVLAAALVPWTLLLVPAAGQRALWKEPRVRFLGLWLVFALAFFSASVNKLPGYILPLVPALAVIFGVASRVAPRWVFAVSALPLVFVPPLAGVLPELLENGWNKTSIPAPPVWAFLAVGAVVFACWKWKEPMLVLALAVMGAVLYLKVSALPVVDAVVSARTRAKNPPVCVAYSQRDLQYGLNYYLGRRVRICE